MNYFVTNAMFKYYTYLYISLVAQRLKASAWNAGDPGSIPGSGRSPGAGHGNPLQYSCLENPCTEEPGELQPTALQSPTRLK